MGHVLSNSGLFDFSHCRLFPVEYRLPARFETIPSRPRFARFGEHERPLGHQSVAEQDAVDAGDERRQCGSPFLNRTLTEISPLRVRRSNATKQARAEPTFVRKAAKSECPSARTATASPSIRALSAAKLQTASAIFGSLSAKFVP
jgi:hypothetical protein